MPFEFTLAPRDGVVKTSKFQLLSSLWRKCLGMTVQQGKVVVLE